MRVGKKRWCSISSPTDFHMPDVFSPSVRSRVMAAIRSRGNANTELRLAKIFRKNRIKGWRRGQKIFGNPDFIFRKIRLAIFVDGCFWHGCPAHGRRPGSNQDYWLPKLERTIMRDKLNTLRLRKEGWTVLRFWEHELRSETAVIARYNRAVIRAQRKSALSRLLPSSLPRNVRARSPKRIPKIQNRRW